MRCPLCEKDDCNGLRHSFGDAVGNGPRVDEGTTADSGWIKLPSEYERGYRAGIEAAARIANHYAEESGYAYTIEKEIRELAPAATTEKP